MKNNKLYGKYRHYKGKYYDVLGEARDVDTQESYVIYRQDYGDKHWWIRPQNMFLDKINNNYVEICRFYKVKDETNIPDIRGKTFSVKHTETGEMYSAKHIRLYGQCMLILENKYGEQMRLKFSYPQDV